MYIKCRKFTICILSIIAITFLLPIHVHAAALIPKKEPFAFVSDAAKKNTGKPEDKLYKDFMKSRKWAIHKVGKYTETYDNVDITDYHIFDFDKDGINELWFEALDFTFYPYGVSGFYTMKDNKIIPLLQGYLSGGSMGGEYIVIRYDTKNKEYVMGLHGFAGGFGGNGSSAQYYSYRKGKLKKIADLFTISQVESNYIKKELNNPALYYIEDTSPFEDQRYITTYNVNNKQTTKSKYTDILKRFKKPSNIKYKISAMDS